MRNNNTLLLNGFYFSVLKRVKYFYLTAFLALSARIMYETHGAVYIIIIYTIFFDTYTIFYTNNILYTVHATI